MGGFGLEGFVNGGFFNGDSRVRRKWLTTGGRGGSF